MLFSDFSISPSGSYCNQLVGACLPVEFDDGTLKDFIIPVATIFPATDEHLIKLLTVLFIRHTTRSDYLAYLDYSSENWIQKWCSKTGISSKGRNEKCGTRPRYTRGKSKNNCRGYHCIPTRPEISDCVKNITSWAKCKLTSLTLKQNYIILVKKVDPPPCSDQWVVWGSLSELYHRVVSERLTGWTEKNWSNNEANNYWTRKLYWHCNWPNLRIYRWLFSVSTRPWIPKSMSQTESQKN